MDRLTAMQVFVNVAEAGSFSAAADKLDMSRAMVTRYVGELEQWLGLRIYLHQKGLASLALDFASGPVEILDRVGRELLIVEPKPLVQLVIGLGFVVVVP